LRRAACGLLAAALPGAGFSGAALAAAPFNVGAGYNFIPDSAYVSLGYRHANFGLDALLLSTGKEERAVRSGPEFSLNALGYLPRFPVFVKLGVVAGWGKYGVDGGFGVDVPLPYHCFLRLQDTYYHATEDRTGGMESENILSAGLHVGF
jgi:hypothetical protein